MIVTRKMLSKMDKTSFVSLTPRTQCECVCTKRFIALELNVKHTAIPFYSK